MTTQQQVAAHVDEWVTGSAISRGIATLNLFSVDDLAQIAQILNWKAYRHTPGWYARTIDPQTGQRKNFGQFKPNEPLEVPDDDRAQKYLTFPKGVESETIHLAVDMRGWEKISQTCGVPITPEDIDEVRADNGFWRWVLDHPEIPITFTEGIKKAACLLSHGYVALALTGVWNGQRKKKLIPSIELFVVPGRPVDLAFDADIVVKEPVEDALRVFGNLLNRAKAIVRIVSWDLELGKGVDDVIATHGSDKFGQIMSSATPYSEWLKKLEGQFQANQKQKAEGKGGSKRPAPPPEPIIIALALVEKYRVRLAWNDEAQSWFQYEGEIPGVWGVESPVAVKAVIQAELDSDPRTALKYGHSYLLNVINLMQPKLLVKRWDNSYSLNIVPLTDGVLHLPTMELRPHAPGYRLTWALPYSWKDRGIGCQPIQAWLLEIMRGDRDCVELLRAYLNCCVTGRVDLHRFLEAIGPGGTGKSTYTRIAKALVGVRNVFTTELKHLEQNRFESSGIYGKRLVEITDSERYVGNITVLKAITGQDSLRYERKYIQQGDGFTPQCMVIVCANEQIQSADYTSGLERRRLTVPFLNEIAPEARRNLIGFLGDKPHGEFEPYLPGLLEWVLAMSFEKVTELVLNTERSIPSLKRARLESLCEANPLADWLDNCIVHRVDEKTYVGVAKRDKSPDSSTTFLFTEFWLYANYCEYSASTGSKPISVRRFSSLLHDLCRSQLKLPGVARGKDRRGSYFDGLIIRRDDDTSPRPITGHEPPGGSPPPPPPSDNPPPPPPSDNGNPPNCDGTVMDCDGTVMAETLASDGCDGCDGFLQNSTQDNQQISDTDLNSQEIGEIGKEGCENPSQSITNPETASEQAFKSSQQPSHCHHNPSQSITNPETASEQAFKSSQQPSHCHHNPSQSTTDQQMATVTPEDPWLTPESLEDIADTVSRCEDSEMLAELRGVWPAHALTAACRRLDADKKEEVRRWVEEQDKPAQNPALAQLPLFGQGGIGESNLDITIIEGAEWLDPEATEYQEQCQAIAQAPIISLDVETFQADTPKKNQKPKALHPWQSRLRLVQLCIGARTFLIDFGGRDRDFEEMRRQQQPTIELLRSVVQNPKQRIIGHNINFDLRFLATQLGIRNAKTVVCTMLGAQVYYGDYGTPEGEVSKGKHEPILIGGYSLANLAKRFLDVVLDKGEQKSDFGAALTIEQLTYAAKDPQITLEVYHKLEALYVDKSSVLYSEGLREKWELECNVIPCAIEIELAGLPLDAEAAQTQLTKIQSRRQTLLEEWTKICPAISYTQQAKLLDYLNKIYQLNLPDLKKGSLDSKARENPLMQIRLKIQGLDSLANNLEGFLNSASRDGRVHTTYKTLTGFGRFSSGGGTPDLPNLQSIKAKINPILAEFSLPPVRAVIRPEPGRTMAVIDLAGAHGRIAAAQTEDETAIAGNNDPSIDNHSKVAVFIAKAQGFDWTWEYIAKVRKDKTNPDSVKAGLFRDCAKNTYYGWLNGAGAQRIQAQIASNTGLRPALVECEAAVEGCKALYPAVLSHRKRLMQRLARESVELEGRRVAINKMSDGFRLCFPLVPSKYGEKNLEAPYTQSIACIWSRIEATAVKRALIKVIELRDENPVWGLQVVNYVHDEIDIEVNTDFAHIAVPIVNDIIGDCFAALLGEVKDGRETNWEKLVVTSWADK